jgi:putative sterol carrier protein
MSSVKDNLSQVIEKINQNSKAQMIFMTNIASKDVDWEMSFQFNLDKESPFYLDIKNRKVTLIEGTNLEAIVVLSGDPAAIVRICEGKGDFTHAISREQITVEKGKVMDVIRLTRAITVGLKKI